MKYTIYRRRDMCKKKTDQDDKKYVFLTANRDTG